MQTVTLRRTVLALVLGAALLAPGVAFAAPAAPEPVAARPGLFQGLWGWLTAFWSGAGAEIDPFGNPGGVVAVWGEAGADIDPFGSRSAGAAPSAGTDHGDAGSAIDPFGGR
jgi:hypothetical protein